MGSVRYMDLIGVEDLLLCILMTQSVQLMLNIKMWGCWTRFKASVITAAAATGF